MVMVLFSLSTAVMVPRSLTAVASLTLGFAAGASAGAFDACPKVAGTSADKNPTTISATVSRFISVLLRPLPVLRWSVRHEHRGHQIAGRDEVYGEAASGVT
jgi:hypothetical protein